MRVTGFTLLEVMVSLVIISIALLGLLALQTASIRYGYSALLHAQGEIQLMNLAQEYLITPQPNLQTWEKTNQIYLPASTYTVSSQQISLHWQAYQLSDQLILPI